MMNTLSSILCEAPSLLSAPSYKETLSQNKIISSQGRRSEQTSLLLLDDTISNDPAVKRTLPINPSMHLYGNPSQIQVNSDIGAFENENDMSVFSDSFPEIVPSWLAHDFMKASEASSPDILSNVSDQSMLNLGFPSEQTRNNNKHLEMLNLEFPSELSSHHNSPGQFNQNCISDGQRLLEMLPIQRFQTNNNSVLMSFNDMPVNRVNMMSYKAPDHISDSSLLSSVLNCENDLMNLPIHTNLPGQCLTSTSSQMISNSQGASQTIDAVCDKLPHINLNNLHSFIGSEAPLPEIQLLGQDFPPVRSQEPVNCNESPLNDSHVHSHNFPGGTESFLNLGPTLRQTQDISVQVTDIALNTPVFKSPQCIPCSKVSFDENIEVTQCFKCRFCDYINLHKCAVDSHIKKFHSKHQDPSQTDQQSFSGVNSPFLSASKNEASTSGLNFPVPASAVTFSTSKPNFTLNNSNFINPICTTSFANSVPSSTTNNSAFFENAANSINIPFVTTAVQNPMVNSGIQNTVSLPFVTSVINVPENSPNFVQNVTTSASNSLTSHLRIVPTTVTSLTSLSTIPNAVHYQCSACNELFSNIAVYKVHLNSCPNNVGETFDNTQKANLQCDKCNKIYADSATFNLHLIKEHKQIAVSLPAATQFKLPSATVSSASSQLTVTSSKPFPSKNEAMNTSEKSKTLRTLKSASPSIASMEDVINNSKSSNSSPFLNGNAVKITPKKDLIKKVLNKSPVPKLDKQPSSHKLGWKKKMNRELGSYICEFKGCNVRFRAVDNLEYHKKCHVFGGKTFACPECADTFGNWSTIAGHLWRAHKNDMELHACDQCSFRTLSLSRLEHEHKLIHQSEGAHLCHTCGKSFKNGKQMRNHIAATHFKKFKRRPREIKCKICAVTFSSNQLLYHHQEIMHNIKPKSHQCKYCSYTTIKGETLKLHMRQHTGEKPFQCDQCDYRTGDHNSLRRHKMKHNGEKPYKCPYCSYSSIQASTYKNHLKKNHPGPNGAMFSCEICSFRTVQQIKYVMHMKDHESLKLLENVTLQEGNTRELSLAEAMDISLSNGDSHISYLNRNKESFFNTNLVSACQESAT